MDRKTLSREDRPDQDECRTPCFSRLRPVITRKPRDRRSRAQRWRDALAELIALQEHWRRCLDALPDTLHDTPYGERLQAMAEADIETLEDLDPPLGYGRDT